MATLAAVSTIIQIGGVPEHFNLPLLLAIERGEFADMGIDLRWTYYPGGTGAMTQALAAGTLDVAILLTEGMIAAVAGGLAAQIIKVYIESPLVWGIYTGAGSSTRSIYDSSPKRYAISRHGSGSHLMAMIHAEQRGILLGDADWEVVKSLEGGIASLERGSSQVFYWERMMTARYVQQGIVRQIGEFSAPWSGFLIVATQQALLDKQVAIAQVLTHVNKIAGRFRTEANLLLELHTRFGMSHADAMAWLDSTVWSTDDCIRTQGLRHAVDALGRIGISPVADIASLCGAGMTLVG
jgi:sulfonate transport system substrate-binding protein